MAACSAPRLRACLVPRMAACLLVLPPHTAACLCLPALPRHLPTESPKWLCAIPRVPMQAASKLYASLPPAQAFFIPHSRLPMQAASKLYANIYTSELGALLGVSADKAEAVASRMVLESRLQVGRRPAWPACLRVRPPTPGATSPAEVGAAAAAPSAWPQRLASFLLPPALIAWGAAPERLAHPNQRMTSTHLASPSLLLSSECFPLSLSLCLCARL